MKRVRKLAIGVVSAISVCALSAASGSAGDPDLSVSMLLAGKIDDKGFMEAGYKGLLAIHDQLGAEISYIDDVKPEPELLADALRKLASEGPDLVIAHGGQNNKAAETVAAEFPDVKFVVVQGGVTGPNLSSYEVLQEEVLGLPAPRPAFSRKPTLSDIFPAFV